MRKPKFVLTTLFAAGLFVNTLPSYTLADEIERLFSTPDERMHIDTLRQKNVFDVTVIKEKEDRPLLDLIPKAPVTFNGIVKRDDGRVSYWINGRETQQKDNNAIKILRGPNRQHQIVLKSQILQTKKRIKPGQTWELIGNKVVEGYATTPKAKPDKENTSLPPHD